MLRIAICDDAPDILEHTASFIKKWDERARICQIERFDNGDDLINAHKSSPFNILILDVIMPLLSGIDTAKEIRTFDTNVKIVFLTSSTDFAIESYSVKASNYLLKPVQPEKLFSTLTELANEWNYQSKHLAIRCSSTVFSVKLDDIEYIEANNKSVHFHLSDGRVLQSIQPLYTYDEKLTLEDGFYRCHRSYIVNLYRVKNFNSKEIQMQVGTLIPISRKYQHEFESTYFEVLFGRVGE